MPVRIDQYRRELQAAGDWDRYLIDHSGLPGPRANLELVEAAGDVASFEVFWRWAQSSNEYLALCGAAGMGRFALADPKALPRLKELAGDSRWRVREGVAIALQRVGKHDMARLLKEMQSWARGSAYVQRAAAAALCEPALLKDPKHVRQVLALLDRITRSFLTSRDRVLRQALGYCWSVAAAASPEDGRNAMEKWLGSDDPDVRWIMRTNLGKARMAALGSRWVASSQKKVTPRSGERSGRARER